VESSIFVVYSKILKIKYLKPFKTIFSINE
jgi:hypothetical protein